MKIFLIQPLFLILSLALKQPSYSAPAILKKSRNEEHTLVPGLYRRFYQEKVRENTAPGSPAKAMYPSVGRVEEASSQSTEEAATCPLAS